MRSVILVVSFLFIYLQKFLVYPTILPITGCEKDANMPFPRSLAWTETQTDSSRISTRIAYFIFSDDNHYVSLTL